MFGAAYEAPVVTIYDAWLDFAGCRFFWEFLKYLPAFVPDGFWVTVAVEDDI